MVKQVIDVGSEPNDGQGDPLRDAFVKTNENFTELYNSTEASFDATNAAFAVANAAGGFTLGGIYTQANTAYFVANAAFDRANSVGGAGIAGSFQTANLAFDAANAAFAVANNSSVANLAFDRANIAVNNVNFVNTMARFAFIQANTAFTVASGLNDSVSIALAQSTLAVSRANAAFNGVGSAYNTANAAFDFANTLTGGGGSGGIIGDSSNIAIAAFRTANAAFDQANTGGGGNGANGLANTTATFEGDLTIKGNTIFLSDIYVNPSIRENVSCTSANSIVIHGTTFGFGTDAPNEYDGWTVMTVGGIDSAFPYNGNGYNQGRHGDIIWLSANGNYIADFYSYDAGSGTDAFIHYYQSNVSFTLASSSYRFNFSQAVDFNQGFVSYGLNGFKRNNPTYEIDVVGTINASAVLVNGLPITGGGGSTLDAANAAFNQANTANLLAFRANVNAAAAFAQANAAYAFANTANVLAFRANVNAAAAFAQANAAYDRANIAIANVNFVNTALEAAISFANAAYSRANLLLSSGNTQPLAAEANSFWFNTDTAELFINYRDWDGTLQWVQINGSYGSGPKELRDINYYVMFYSPGVLDSNVTMYLNKAPTRYYLPANLTGSFAISDGAPAGNTANLRILKNGSYIGNIAFAQGNSNGSFVFPNQVTFDQGDVLRITSPAGPIDSTFSDVSITITGVKITP